MQKVELKVVGVLEVRIWGGAGLSVLVCRWGAAFEMDWWKCGGVSVDITTTTMAKAKLRLNTLAFIYSFIEHDRFDFLRLKKE